MIDPTSPNYGQVVECLRYVGEAHELPTWRADLWLVEPPQQWLSNIVGMDRRHPYAPDSSLKPLRPTSEPDVVYREVCA